MNKSPTFLQSLRNFLIIFSSFFIALILNLLPLPEWALSLRPEWVFLVLTYWLLMVPERIGLGIAVIVGIVMDVATGSILGVHSFGMVLLGYGILKVQHVVRLYSLWQQSVFIFFLGLAYQFILFWAYTMTGVTPDTLLYWLPSLFSALIWPWILSVLVSCQLKYTTYTP